MLKALYETFLQERRFLRNCSPKTLRSYGQAWNAFEPHLISVTNSDGIRAAIKAGIAEKMNVGTLKPSSINVYFGAGWKYQHPSEIMDEIAALSPLFAGVNYQRLEGYKTLQWPVSADGTDQPLLYTKEFAFPNGKARLFPLSWHEPQEQPDSQYDLHLNNGRLLEHFHEGNLTHRSPGIRAKTPDTFVEVSPELARERGIESGTLVKLSSRHGQVRVRVLVSDRVRNGELYMPMNSAAEPVNRLTGSLSDPVTHTPGYKETAVKLEVLAANGESPLPRTNFRFGHPTPQRGVEVERKWQQPGYRFPGPNGSVPKDKLIQIDDIFGD